MNLFFEPLQHEFMMRALMTGLLVGGLCALIGVFVVTRGLSFLGDGLAHAAFGGIALGLFFDASSEWSAWVALPFTVLIALCIAWVHRSGRLSGDAATGVFFAISFALGVLLLSLRGPEARAINVESILFGSILSVRPLDLWIVAAVCLVAAIALFWSWGKLAYATFDAELAQLSGVQVAVQEYSLFAFTAVVIVVAVKTVGVVLVSSFLVIPAASAALVARRLPTMSLIALGIGVLGSGLGLLLSYHLDVPSGATIILLLGAIFFGAFAVRR